MSPVRHFSDFKKRTTKVSFTNGGVRLKGRLHSAAGVVYNIACQGCHIMYISETGCLRTVFGERLRSVEGLIEADEGVIPETFLSNLDRLPYPGVRLCAKYKGYQMVFAFASTAFFLANTSIDKS